jgi:hypothetical protein
VYKSGPGVRPRPALSKQEVKTDQMYRDDQAPARVGPGADWNVDKDGNGKTTMFARPSLKATRFPFLLGAS